MTNSGRYVRSDRSYSSGRHCRPDDRIFPTNARGTPAATKRVPLSSLRCRHPQQARHGSPAVPSPQEVLHRKALATAMRTMSLAFSVARSGLSACTQESWFRMLAISTRYLFRPALMSVSWKSGFVRSGGAGGDDNPVQALFRMTSVILSWVSWEQVNRFSST